MRKTTCINVVGADSAITLQITAPPALLTWNAAAGRSYDVLSATNAAVAFLVRATVIPTNSTGQWLETNATTCATILSRQGYTLGMVFVMRKIRQEAFRVLLLWLVFFLVAPKLSGEDSLVWHREQNRVDADIESWDLRNLSNHVAAATTAGWVFLDPGAAFIRSRSNLKTCPAVKPFI